MMATVLRKVKLGNKIKSETVTQNGEPEKEERNRGNRVPRTSERLVFRGKSYGRTRERGQEPGESDKTMGNHRRRNRPQSRRNPTSHLTLFQSLQLRIDLWTSTTGHLLDRSFARRFCNRKSDNELYRSNSFRFEKFDKEEEDPQQQYHVPRVPKSAQSTQTG
ncbi:hypothetical protein RUM44_006056 [Polyplax serrata]|uniref:Uncharacterized protein n=1 Tax=Polyplax serrata TaxID=468196 RepID=A0ABR1AYZ0_POLSC